MRLNKTHYVYQEWVAAENNQEYCINHVFTVGENGVTLEQEKVGNSVNLTTKREQSVIRKIKRITSRNLNE